MISRGIQAHHLVQVKHGLSRSENTPKVQGLRRGVWHSLRWVAAIALIPSFMLAACQPAAQQKPPQQEKPPPAAAPQQTGQPAPAKEKTAPTPFALKVGAVPASQMAPLYVADGKGYFKEQGFDVSFEPMFSGPEALTTVAAGQQHIGSGTGAALFNAVKAGTNVKIIGPMLTIEPNADPGVPLIVRKDLWDTGVVKKVSDLKGRKVSVPSAGTAVEWLLDGALKAEGLSVRDVELVFLGFGEVAAALPNKAIDAAMSAEPVAAQLLEAGLAVKLSPQYPPGSEVVFLVMGGDLLKSNPEVAERVMVAYLKASRDLYKDGWRRDDNVAIIAERLRVPPAIIKKITPSFVDPNGKVDISSVQRQEKFYMDRGYLKYDQPLDPATYYDEGPVKKALERVGRSQ